MAPRFIERMRAMNLPPEPPLENPNETARLSWEQLRDYAAKILTLAHETDDANKMLTAEVESLRRENQRLADENARIAREHRAATAYAQSLRTRLTSVREQIEVAERDSLQYAQHAMRTGVQHETAEEVADASRMARKIERLEPAQPAALPTHPPGAPRKTASMPANAFQ